MSGLLGLLSNAVGGGLIGAIASGFNKWQDTKLKLATMDKEMGHEQRMFELETESTRLQLESAERVANIQADAEVRVADLSALESSMDHDTARYANIDTTKTNRWFIFVDFIRGIMRPAITGGLTAYIMVVALYTLTVHGADFTDTQLTAMTLAILDALTVYAGLAISWWFGSRGHQRS